MFHDYFVKSCVPGVLLWVAAKPDQTPNCLSYVPLSRVNRQTVIRQPCRIVANVVSFGTRQGIRRIKPGCKYRSFASGCQV